MGIDRAGISQVSRPNGSSVIVFSYGSNMLSTRILERAPSATVMGIGQLVGFELCWNKRSDDKSGKCSVTETGHPQRVVWGVVHEMSAVDITNSCPFRQQLLSKTRASSKEAPQIHRFTKGIWKKGTADLDMNC